MRNFECSANFGKPSLSGNGIFIPVLFIIDMDTSVSLAIFLVIHGVASGISIGLSGIPFEPRRKKTGLRGFRPSPTQTELYSHRRQLEA